MSQSKRSTTLFLVVFISILVVGFFGLLFLSSFFFSSDGGFFKKPVAIVEIRGGIFDPLETLKELEKIRTGSMTVAIVLRIDSPGGAVAPSQEIHEQILKLRERGIKVVASLGTIAASGGYYIASAADKIVASPGTITGSIGVITQSFGIRGLVEKLSIEPRTIKSGRYKDIGSPFEKMDQAERDYYQNLSDNIYGQFLQDVSEQRKIPLDQIKTLAEGRIYTGLQAKEKGLVDRLGNLYDALALAKAEAGLPEDAEVSWPKPSRFEKFFKPKMSLRQEMENFVVNFSVQSLPMLWFKGTDPKALF